MIKKKLCCASERDEKCLGGLQNRKWQKQTFGLSCWSEVLTFPCFCVPVVGIRKILEALAGAINFRGKWGIIRSTVVKGCEMKVWSLDTRTHWWLFGFEIGLGEGRYWEKYSVALMRIVDVAQDGQLINSIIRKMKIDDARLTSHMIASPPHSI